MPEITANGVSRKRFETHPSGADAWKTRLACRHEENIFFHLC